MKKKYYALIYISLIVIAILIYYYNTNFEQVVLNLALISIIIYIVRKPIFNLTAFLFRKRFYHAVISIIVNLIWSIFLLWLLYEFSNPLFFAIVPFLIVSVSINFNKIVNNIAAGAIMLGSEQFQISDLIETNGVQGIVEEINLNYLMIKEFDGLKVIIPNSNVYGSSIVKFTHNKFRTYPILSKQEFGKKKDYRAYLDRINKLINSEIKTTTYIKNVFILDTINPQNLDNLLAPVFDKYKPILGIRPDYAVESTEYGRLGINLYIKSDDPRLILNNIDCFLRDILFQLYPEVIFDGWEKYKESISKDEIKGGGNSQ
jgi:hypothetical protein